MELCKFLIVYVEDELDFTPWLLWAVKCRAQLLIDAMLGSGFIITKADVS